MPEITIEVHGTDTAGSVAELVWPCYRDVFGDFGDFETWNADMYGRHSAREGYRLVVARDGATLAGFSWGYIGQRGQYWPDLVCQALPDEIADEWVGGHFEFTELAVLPSYRSRGLGRVLHDTLLDGIRRRCLLGTADDPDDPAVRLYLGNGWHKLGVLRPGVQVMGRLPG